MDKITIKEKKQNFWNVAEVFKNNEHMATVNKFYEVDKDWIYIYDTLGGSGTGWSKGQLLKKISITNCEFEIITSQQKN